MVSGTPAGGWSAEPDREEPALRESPCPPLPPMAVCPASAPPASHDARSEPQPPAQDSLLKQREALFAEFTPLVRRLIRQYGDDSEIRQELEGEIYCRFCALLDAYDPTRGVPLRPYLVRQLTASIYTFARHHWRRQRREVSLELDAGGGEPLAAVDPTDQWTHDLTVQQVLKALPEAIGKLPRRQRQVVIWRYYEERSFEEIAQRLDVQLATARSLLRHGLNNLRRWIAQEHLEY